MRGIGEKDVAFMPRTASPMPPPAVQAYLSEIDWLSAIIKPTGKADKQFESARHRREGRGIHAADGEPDAPVIHTDLPKID